MYCLTIRAPRIAHGCGANSAGDYRAETDQRRKPVFRIRRWLPGRRLERGPSSAVSRKLVSTTEFVHVHYERRL